MMHQQELLLARIPDLRQCVCAGRTAPGELNHCLHVWEVHHACEGCSRSIGVLAEPLQ